MFTARERFIQTLARAIAKFVNFSEEEKECLRYFIDQDVIDSTVMLNRINKFNNNLHLLYPLLKDRNIPRKVKLVIYTTILRPVLTYGHESWTLTSRTRSKVQATEMKVLRLIKGVTRMDRIRNVDIRNELEIDDILKLIERGQLRWFGHVKRMENARYPRKFFEWQPDGTRPVGRPKRRWGENVDSAMQRRGYSIQQVEDARLYEDRQRWGHFLRQDD